MNKKDKFYYFNFEDPKAVNFELSDFEKLDDVFKEEFGECDYFFLMKFKMLINRNYT
jgi:uncharacterized protein